MSGSSSIISRGVYVVGLLVIALVVGLVCCKVRRTTWFSERIELPLYDTMIRAGGAPQKGHPEALLVTIEDADGWPLNDDVLADTLEAILAGGATVVGLDMIRDLAIPPGPDDPPRHPEAPTLAQIGINSRVIWIETPAGAGELQFTAPPFILALDESERGNHLASPLIPADDPNLTIRRGNVSDGRTLSLAAALAGRYHLFSIRDSGEIDWGSMSHEERATKYRELEEKVYLKLSRLGSLSPSAGGYWLFDDEGQPIAGDGFLFKVGKNPGSAIDKISHLELMERWHDEDDAKWEKFSERLQGKMVMLGTNSPTISKDEIVTATDQELRGMKLQALQAAQLMRELEGENPISLVPDRIEDLILILAALLSTVVFVLKRSALRWAGFLVIPLATWGSGTLLLNGNEPVWLPVGSIMMAEAATGLAGLGFIWLIGSRERSLYFTALEKQLGKEVAAAVVSRVQKVASGMNSKAEVFEGTVLFGDLSGFSKACERYSEEGRIEDFFDWLNNFLRPAVELSGSCGGFVKQFAGDGIFVVFGFPQGSRNDHAQRAVECATRIGHFVAQLNREITGDFPPYYVRFGIYTGEIHATSLGSEEQFDFTFMGTTTNKASRLEGLDRTKFRPEECPVRILISDPTKQAIEDSPAVLPFGDGLTELKGFEDKPEQVWEVKIDCKNGGDPR